MRLLSTVVRKELRELARDGRLRVLGALVVVLTLAALPFGAQQTEQAEHARAHARAQAESQWQGQGEKNPHVAAHYGTHVFAPTSAATALDPGASAFLGRSLKIEAHRRNLPAHAAAADGGGLRRLTVAGVLLQLVPLLIIALGYGAWSRERERRTLAQVLATGVARGTLAWGKAIALAAVVAGLLIPAGLVTAGTLWALGGGDGGTLVRMGLLAGGYAIYFAVFGALTLFASARARSSRAALVGLIGAWGLFTLILPRVAGEVAGAMSPLPSRAALARDIAAGLERGLDGQTDREAAVEAMTRELMAADGITAAGMLMDDEMFSVGYELQAEARWEDAIFDHHIRAFDDRVAAQERWIAAVGLLSPYVAMRSLSAGLSGTDVAHHRHFTEYAEGWRKALVAQLDTAFAEQAGAEGWAYRAGPELWSKAPPFAYAAPGPGFALATHGLSVLALLGWLLLAVGLAIRAARRVEVV